MNRISVQHWDKPMNVFLVVSHKLVRDTLMEQVKHVFAQYQQTALPKVLERIILIYLNGLKEEHLRHAQEIYNIERHKPFTMATSALTQATKEVLEYFVARRREARARLYLRLFHGNAVDDQKRNVEIRKLISNDSEMGPDEFAQEVKMMAVSEISISPKRSDSHLRTYIYRASEDTTTSPVLVLSILFVKVCIQSCSLSAVRNLSRLSKMSCQSLTAMVCTYILHLPRLFGSRQ